MGNYISFRPLDATLPTYVCFALTNKGMDKINQHSGGEALKVLTHLSASRVLMAMKGKQKTQDEVVKFFSSAGTFLCKRTNDNKLLIMDFYKNTLIDQNRAMKYGVCFHVSAGIIIELNDLRYNWFFDIFNGGSYADQSYRNRDCSASTNMIMEQVSRTAEEADQEAEQIEEEEYKPAKKLADLLQLAESYSILSSQLEEQKAKNEGNVAYNGISSLDFHRTDRVAYRFGVETLDESLFKTGVQVDIEDRNQERHTAEIIALVKENEDAPATAVDLLFNDHVSIHDLMADGWFNLSFSTVNKDVQIAANERIKTGEAQSKYMDDIFGRNQPAGFENKDLAAVRESMANRKYPMNKSQMDAVCAGINSKDVFLVMGPPGTGKTTVILEWVKYFVQKEQKRVLISSQNNKAVDNVLERIAKEKNIDIIRIGSEAKLQSEVVPFMFENKVTALRKSISVDSVVKCQTIDRLVEQWAPYAQQVWRTVSVLERQYYQQRRLAEQVNSTVAPIYREMMQWKDRCFESQEKRTACAEKIRELAPGLMKHEDATNFLSRFFTGFGYKAKVEQMRNLVAQMDALDNDIHKCCERYNRCRQQFNMACDQVRDTLYLRYEQACREYEVQFRAIPEMPPREAEDIWNLFAEVRSFTVTVPADCDGLKQRLQQGMDRARDLKEVLGRWRVDMESKQNYALNEIVLESVDLVGATCIGINSQKRFANLDFDVTIIDEAGQIQVHNALVPMSVSNKLIMLGDHKQIPPSADRELVELCEANGVKPDLLEMSLFEKMYQDLPDSNKMMLDTQYRMPAEIADTISEWFYNGEYYSPDFKRNLKSLIPALSDRPYVIIDTSAEANRYETKIEGKGSSNALEAAIVAELIRHISDDPENDLKQIGVISAYKSQVRLIKNRISRFLSKDLVSEMVASLDSYQGQERDIIIYSFTKSSDISPYRQRIGFLNELRRLNVAMTRCKKMLILVGDMQFLAGCKNCPKDENGQRIEAKSEYEFSRFINKMLGDVRGGRGELISCREFKERMKGAKEQ